MANMCQCCNTNHINPTDWRSLWLGMATEGFYLEWGKCCGDKTFAELGRDDVVLTNNVTGATKTLKTPNEVWILIAGEQNADLWGQAIWY